MGKTRFDSVEELFTHLLKNYEDAETACIWEMSGHIAESEKKLQEEIAAYKSEFARLNVYSIKKVEKHKDKHYCECGCPVEIMLDGITLKPIGGQIYCDQCGAKLDWSEFVEKGE